MIRMGRSSKPEPQQPEKPNFGQNTPVPETQTSFQTNTYQPVNRALAESESMARDIKEGRLSGFVGSGTMLTGETNFKAMLRVDGHLTGKVSSDSGTLIIGTGGQVDANIRVAAAIINGTVNGDIIATEKIELGRTARVLGNIQTPVIMIEQGAVFEGNCTMLKARKEKESKLVEAENAAVYSSEPEPIITGEEVSSAAVYTAG
jgi:cytoskeletal protein CcmA (bactofilin family)